MQYVAPQAGNSLTPWAHGKRREIETQRHARLIMSVHNNFSSTRFSSMAPTPPAPKPAAQSNLATAPTAQEAAAEPLPSLPSGLVGHNVNTTA